MGLVCRVGNERDRDKSVDDMLIDRTSDSSATAGVSGLSPKRTAAAAAVPSVSCVRRLVN